MNSSRLRLYSDGSGVLLFYLLEYLGYFFFIILYLISFFFLYHDG